jgi:predicted metal-dependent HD superfamily phosphohydrolase
VNLERWSALMRGLGVDEHPEMFERVRSAYCEPHRHYHTVAHIDACLREFDAVRPLAEFPYLVEAALWFHDVVYEPTAADNERRSADLAANFLGSAGVPAPACARLRAHIIATMHDAEAADPDAALVVDVDLAILGQDPAIYDAFETQIRQEYAFVPVASFRRGRVAILRSFLDRERIYSTAQLRSRYEQQARRNLRRAIDRLTRSMLDT